MRITFAIPMILACGLALPAAAQPAAQPADGRVQTASATAPPASAEAGPTAAQRAKEQEESAAAALAMSIRQREIEERRIAKYACLAGDTSKCQAADASADGKTPSPSP